MWTCSNCSEQHSDEFDTCWNCGTNVNGQRDPSFTSESPDNANSDIHVDICDPLTHRLPDITYYSIPVFFLLFPFVVLQWTAFETNDASATNLARNVASIAIYLAGVLLIGVPFFAMLMRLAFYSLMRNHPAPSNNWGVRLLVDTFRLPDHIANAHRWFTPIYYSSFLLYFVGPVVALFCRH